MKLRDDLRIAMMEEGYVIYDPENERILQLNITSSFLLEMLLDGKSEEEIVHDYSRVFGVSEEVARGDLEKFLLMMRQEGLVAD